MVGLFLIAGGNSAKVLEFTEPALDDMALPVHVPVTASLHFAVGFGWNHCRDVTLYKPVEQGIGLNPLSARSALVLIPCIRGVAWVMSAAWPPVKIKRTGKPSASISA